MGVHVSLGERCYAAFLLQGQSITKDSGLLKEIYLNSKGWFCIAAKDLFNHSIRACEWGFKTSPLERKWHDGLMGLKANWEKIPKYICRKTEKP